MLARAMHERKNEMKFICQQQNLIKALNIVSKAVSVRTTIPVLKGIMLKAESGKLTMSASDLDLSIQPCASPPPPYQALLFNFLFFPYLSSPSGLPRWR